MMDGWYCRSVANAASVAAEEERVQEESKFKKEYKFLKRKLQNLIYENESFRQALRNSQRELLSITRDRNFLLDRLLVHEKIDHSTSESDNTDSSDEDIKVDHSKRRKDSSSANHNNFQHGAHQSSGKVIKKKRPSTGRAPRQHFAQSQHQQIMSSANVVSEYVSPEDNAHTQHYMDFISDGVPTTIPSEMFSNEPSLDSESNDIGELETSPSNIGEELSIDMMPE